jgi:Zn-dependent protease
VRIYPDHSDRDHTGELTMDRSPTSRWLPPQPARDPAQGPLGPAQAPPRPPLWRRLVGPLLVAGALLARLLGELKGLLLLAPKLKLLATFSSMIVSVAAYALIWGWRFAAGFVALLFVHEAGHAIQMRREGVKPNWMIFIPFLGAAVGARSLGGNALAEARIGLAGPVIGTAGALLVLAGGAAAGSDLLLALAYTGLFLNLFNLVPVVPFDGGRAMAAMAPWMWGVGFAAMLALFVVAPNPFLVLFLLLGGMESWRRWRGRRRGEEGNPAYYRVAPRHRLAVGAVYVGLVLVCALGMHLAFIDRSAHLTG